MWWVEVANPDLREPSKGWRNGQEHGGTFKLQKHSEFRVEG